MSERHDLLSASGTGHAHLSAERVITRTIPKSNIVLRVVSFSAAALVVEQSDLITTLPARMTRLLAREMDLQVVLPSIDLPRIHISQYWHERFHREPGNKWLRSVLVRLFSENPGKTNSLSAAPSRRIAKTIPLRLCAIF